MTPVRTVHAWCASIILASCGGAGAQGAQAESSTAPPSPETSTPASTASSLPCIAGPAPQGSPAARLDWMIGTWVSSDDEDSETTERWCIGEGGVLLGESHTRAGDRVVESEQLRIEARGDALLYVASPSTQAATEFTGDARCGSDVVMGNCDRSCEATFANPQHDFPTEIVYASCVQSRVMVATIRGGDRRASWTFHAR
jgi:hypothetical protein